MIDTNSPAVASGTNDSYTLPAQAKERPILFSGAMVRAILDGRKTQTRRIVKGVALEWLDDAGFDPHFVAKDNDLCPYGKVGDRLWVRETWQYNGAKYRIGDNYEELMITYKADGCHDIIQVPHDKNEIARLAPKQPLQGKLDEYEYSDLLSKWFEKYRPSIHMPRWASRIDLEITDIRVERVQDISDNDIEFEGVEVFGDSVVRKTLFADLWNEINKKRGYGWDKNPWVWVVTFKRV